MKLPSSSQTLLSLLLYASTALNVGAAGQASGRDDAFENELRRELAQAQNARIEERRLAQEIERRAAVARARQGLRSDGTPMPWPEAVATLINSNWNRPDIRLTGPEGCAASISIAPNGEVAAVDFVTPCASYVLRESIVSAILKTSPLPLPAEPATFNRTIRARFVPRDEP